MTRRLGGDGVVSGRIARRTASPEGPPAAALLEARWNLQRELAERQRAEEALRKSEERFRRIAESVTDYVFTVSVEYGRVVGTRHGPGCVTVTGYTAEEFARDPDLWLRMVLPEDRAAVLELAGAILAGGQLQPHEHRIVRKDGVVRWVRNTPVPQLDDEGRMVAYDGLIQDITERRILEERLRQAHKMEAIGQLAGGVAHDFNNLLTVIRGFAELLESAHPVGDPNRSDVIEIERAADRAAQLTRQLLAFSRRQVVHPVPLDLSEVVTETAPLLRRLVGEDVEVSIQASLDLPRVLADRGQLEQVLLNLAANARDAMPEGGTLGIEVSAVQIDAEFVQVHGGSRPGRHISLAVSDTGVGMDEATQAHLFEPFFTTKESGKGTGLGLASVYGIVKQAGGAIYAESQLGQGSTFRIYLPAAMSGDVEGATADSVARDHAMGSEAIMLVEDEPGVRAFAQRALENHGYRVVACQSPVEALEAATGDPNSFDLVITDVVMPRMSGQTLVARVRDIRGGVPVLFMSGYGSGQLPGPHLAKPFTGCELANAVRGALDDSAGVAATDRCPSQPAVSEP